MTSRDDKKDPTWAYAACVDFNVEFWFLKKDPKNRYNVEFDNLVVHL